jgi:hypothetical protein
MVLAKSSHDSAASAWRLGAIAQDKCFAALAKSSGLPRAACQERLAKSGLP